MLKWYIKQGGLKSCFLALTSTPPCNTRRWLRINLPEHERITKSEWAVEGAPCKKRSDERALLQDWQTDWLPWYRNLRDVAVYRECTNAARIVQKKSFKNFGAIQVRFTALSTLEVGEFVSTDTKRCVPLCRFLQGGSPLCKLCTFCESLVQKTDWSGIASSMWWSPHQIKPRSSLTSSYCTSIGVRKGMVTRTGTGNLGSDGRIQYIGNYNRGLIQSAYFEQAYIRTASESSTDNLLDLKTADHWFSESKCSTMYSWKVSKQLQLSGVDVARAGPRDSLQFSPTAFWNTSYSYISRHHRLHAWTHGDLCSYPTTRG